MKIRKLAVLLTAAALTAAAVTGCTGGKETEAVAAGAGTGTETGTTAESTAAGTAAEESSEEETADSMAAEDEENYDTGDASKDNTRNQDGIGEDELLVVSFGTSYPETRKKNIEHLETLLAEAFPDRTFYRAYTSGIIRKKLWERDQILSPSVKEAAQAALEDGITDLLVQPTHIMNGIENDQMKEDILNLESHFDKISFGDPLIASTEDQFAVIEALMEELPCLSDQEALVFMGHGSTHHANTLYAALDLSLIHI